MYIYLYNFNKIDILNGIKYLIMYIYFVYLIVEIYVRKLRDLLLI